MTRRRVVPFSVVQEDRHQRQRFGRAYSVIAAFYDVSMWTVRDWCEYRTRVAR